MRIAALVVLLLSSAAFAEPAPRIAMGTPKLTGAIDAKLVGTTLRAAQTKLGDCYTQARAKAPTLRGTATVTFTIAADGKAVATSATGLDQNAEACIAGVVGKLVFGKPKEGKGVDVSVAIIFEPGVANVANAESEGKLGSVGLGRTGFGPGGGCGAGAGWGTIGTGRYGTIGNGGCGGGSAPASTVPTVSFGQPTTTGGLDKAVVRRFLKRNNEKLLYCYERELLATPAIRGTVTVEFTISGTGLVSASSGNGVHKNVDSCVAAVIKAIEFPKPKNGRDTRATIAFTFRPANG